MRSTLPWRMFRCLAAALLWGVSGVPVRSAEPPAAALEDRFIQAYDIETQVGEVGEAIRLYQRVAEAAAETNPILAARAWLRIGLCQRKLGQWNEAEQAFRTLLGQAAAGEAIRAQAETELAGLLARRLTVRLHGTVMDSAQPVPGAWVMAGQWLFDPPVLTDETGAFSIERKVGGEIGSDRRALPLYAEDPVRPLAFLGVVRPASSDMQVTPLLRPMVSVMGRVADLEGQPVGGARLKVSVRPEGETDLWLPVDRVMPPVFSDPRGDYRIPVLVSGTAFRVTADLPGWELLRPVESLSVASVNTLSDLVLIPMGTSFVAGRVTDESGQPLNVTVRAFSMPPECRELGMARTDRNGTYRVEHLPVGRFLVRAESFDTYATRQLTGVLSGSDDANFVLSAAAGVEPLARQGQPAPDPGGMAVNSGPWMLGQYRNEVVLLYFWDRRQDPVPPEWLGTWQNRWGAQGLEVVAIHDHSGRADELVPLLTRERTRYPVLIDRYAPTAERGGGNNLAFGRYGVQGRQVAVIDRAGLLLAVLPLATDGDAEAVGGLLKTQFDRHGTETVSRPAPAAALPGAPAPELEISAWVRGDPASGAAVNLAGWRGRWGVVHFGSAYVAGEVKAEYPEERLAFEQVLGRFEAVPVEGLWVLPTSEGTPAATELAGRVMERVPIAVDRDGLTYGAYQAGWDDTNVIIAPDGRVAVAGCDDTQLFAVLKSLVGR